MDYTNTGLSPFIYGGYDFGCDAFTIHEVLARVSDKMNVIIDHFLNLDKDFKNLETNVNMKLDYLLGQGLSEQVSLKIIELVDNGTLGKLINETLLRDINIRIDKNVVDINKLGQDLGLTNEALAVFKELTNEEIRVLNLKMEQVNGRIDNTNEALNSLDDKVTDRITFRMCSANIFHEHCNIPELVSTMKNNAVDVIGMQEAHTIEAMQPLLVEYPNTYRVGENSINAIYSKFPLTENYDIPMYNVGDHRRHISHSILNVKNKTISLFNLHFDAQFEEQMRIFQLRELADIINGCKSDYVIITGDFNVRLKQLYRLLGDGYVSLQGFKGVYYDTWIPNDNWGNKSLDNIIVSNNITFENPFTVSPSGSDHYPLVADIVLHNMERTFSYTETERKGLTRYIDFTKYKNVDMPTTLIDNTYSGNDVWLYNSPFRLDKGFTNDGYRMSGTDVFIRGNKVSECRTLSWSCRMKELRSNECLISLFFDDNYVNGQGGGNGGGRVLSILTETPWIGNVCLWDSAIGRTVRTGATYPYNEMTHYSLVINDDLRTGTIYQNGVVADTFDIGGVLPHYPSGVIIGKAYTTATDIVGTFGYLKQYTNFLSASEIMEEYLKEIGR